MKETLVDACGALAATAVPTLSTPERAARTSNSEVMVLSLNFDQRKTGLGALINLLGRAPKSM